MIKKCYAKLNLTLDSLYKRKDGYHEIDSIMTRISLCDLMEIDKTNTKELRIFSNGKQLKNIEDNLIYKAWALLKDGIKNPGIDVNIQKRIPFAAGLAGGSTDCAEMMKALNEMWNLGLSQNELMKKGKILGADVPFFFLEKSARARGIGEVLTPISIKTQMPILLINDGTEISSQYIYERLGDFGHINNERIICQLENGNREAILDFENVMETVAFEKYPHLKKIKEELTKVAARKTLMSGSGASIFAIFDYEKDLNMAYENLKGKYEFVEKVSLIDD